jgi:NADPH-dependent ferric siderophore reductase
MASGKGLLLGALGGWVLRKAEVTSVVDVGAHFRRVSLAGKDLVGQRAQLGDKLQMLLPSRDVRTYTPIAWDQTAGTTSLLVFHHTDSPAGAWVRSLAAGAWCSFVGPQRSLDVPPKAERLLVFGDETSCALVESLTASLPWGAVTALLEVTDPQTQRSVEAALGAPSPQTLLFLRDADDRHLETLATALQARVPASEAGHSSTILFTGRAQGIQRLRTLLRERGATARAVTRAYWSLGKAGLD